MVFVKNAIPKLNKQPLIFVTGATGLVGKELIIQLLTKGYYVKAIYRTAFPSDLGKDLPGKLEWVQGDILDITSLEDALIDVTHVYHCAAIVSFHPRNRQQMFSINIEGTKNVVNACINAGIQKLLFVSSVAALGRIRENEAIVESMQWSPETSNSAYGQTKYLSELEVWRGISEGLSAVIVNPVIILGPGNWEKGSSGIFKSAYNEFPWFTEGMSGFVYVADVVKAMILLMESEIEGEKFIISAENLHYKDVFSKIALAFGKKPPHKKVQPWMAAIVWRIEMIKSFFTGKEPLLTKETAQTAQAVVRFDNCKLLKRLPEFKYTPIDEAIQLTCRQLKKEHSLI